MRIRNPGCVFTICKKLPSFWPIQTEKEIFYFNKNGKFKFQTDLDRYGPRPLLNDSHLAGSPPFLLYTIFKYFIF
jgi:hypothetical protein